MYIGNDLQVAESGNKIIDDISSSFNGSTTSFALTVGGYAPVPFPINTQQIYISVNGVIQEPDPSGSAGFKLLGSNIVFSSAPGSGQAFFGVILSGADYVTVGTEFPAGSATAPSMTFIGDTDTGLYSVTAGTVGFTSDGTQTFTMDGNGFNFPDGKKVNLGSSSDLAIWHSGSHSYIEDSGTGSLYIDSNQLYLRNADTDNVLLYTTSSGEVRINHNGNTKIQTTSSGVEVTGTVTDDGATHDGDVTFTGANANVVWDKSADDLIFNDNAKASFGTSSDLEIYHSGSESFIDEKGTGKLFIRSNEVRMNKYTGEFMIKAIADAAVELYYDNDRKIRTTASGVEIESATGDAYTVIHAEEDDSGSDAFLRLLVSNTDATSGIQFGDDGDNDIGQILYEHSDNSLRFRTNAAEQWRITSAGHLENNSDSSILKLGSGDDFQLYHDGTNNEIRSSGAKDIYIRPKDTDVGVKVIADGAVELYHDNGVRIATTADGTDFSGTGSIKLPVGTTAQRNGSPTAGDMRYNTTTGSFEGYTSAWGALGGGATGGGSDAVFFENGQTVTTNYTITNNMNAGSFGPITINSGVTVTVGSGEVWTVV
jgi:hypothetical protein